MRVSIIFDIKWLASVHLYKDVGMLPFVLNKYYNHQVEIVYISNPDGPIINNTLGINLVPLEGGDDIVGVFARYIEANALKIDVLVFFHPRYTHCTLSEIYKKKNPNGITYLKLDMNKNQLDRLYAIKNYYSNIRNYFTLLGWIYAAKRYFEVKKFIKIVSKFDLISCETIEGFNVLKKIIPDCNLLYLPNGFLNNGCIQPDFFEKKNIFITVGRIGSKEKRHEDLLKALGQINLKNWIFKFIGPVEESFQSTYDGFIESHPELSEKIFLCGPMNSKVELYQQYAIAKVFCLSSEWEGFPLVFPEALFFGNYIVSSKIGADYDITKSGKLGESFEIGDVENLASILQKIIDEPSVLQEKYNMIIDYSIREFDWIKIISKLNKSLLEIHNEKV